MERLTEETKRIVRPAKGVTVETRRPGNRMTVETSRPGKRVTVETSRPAKRVTGETKRPAKWAMIKWMMEWVLAESQRTSRWAMMAWMTVPKTKTTVMQRLRMRRILMIESLLWWILLQ